MKLAVFGLVLSCYVLHASANECSLDQIITVQQQWTTTFGSNHERLVQFGMAYFMRSALLDEFAVLIVHANMDAIAASPHDEAKSVAAKGDFGHLLSSEQHAAFDWRGVTSY